MTARLLPLLLLLSLVLGCAGGGQRPAQSTLAELRKSAPESDDA